MEDGVCLQRQLSGVQEHKCTVHIKVGAGQVEAAGAASEGQGQWVETGTPAPGPKAPLLLAVS